MLSKRLNFFIKNKYMLIACIILIGYLLPYYLLGEDTHIRLHDNLDSNIVWYKILAESGQIFTLTDTTLPNVINGLPRSALPSGFDAVVWLYVLFEPMTAYSISQTIMRFAALFGMYFLLSKHIFRAGSNTYIHIITVGASLGFAMLPYWPSGVLSIAGIPLALYLFLTIRKNGWDVPKYLWILLFIIPSFSNFVLSFVFFLGLLGILWLIDWIRSKQINWPFFTAITAMTGIYLIKDYLLIVSMFFDEGFTSHRDELDLGYNTFERSVELSWENFLYGHTHDNAAVTACDALDGKYLVYLDRSAFYPTSGGQPYDTGTIDGAHILDVFVDANHDVCHVTDAPLDVGQTVRGRIDWPRRFEHMQQHAGDHMIASAIWRHFGGVTIGLHLGETVSTIDVDMPGGKTHQTPEQVRLIERDVNARIQRDVPVCCWFPTPEELEGLPLRKKPTVTEHVRVVAIGDDEMVACGGTHPATAGQIGLVKIVGAAPARGKLRVSFLAGMRAYGDYQ